MEKKTSCRTTYYNLNFVNFLLLKHIYNVLNFRLSKYYFKIRILKRNFINKYCK